MKLYIVTALIAICIVASCAPQPVYVVVTATPPPTRTDAAPSVVEVTAMPLPRAPDTTATQASFATMTFARLTVSAATRAHAQTPTRVPTPTRTLTRVPRDISLLGLSRDEERTIKDAVDLLGFCAPPLKDYVRTRIDTVTRGAQRGDGGQFVVYLAEEGSLYDPWHYNGALRTFVAAVALVHEARHFELGIVSTEPDAYGFTLPLFDNPRCVPNDIGTFTISEPTPVKPGEWEYVGGSNEQMPRSYCPFFILHSYTKWRASLPYREEPPAYVHPPEIPRVCHPEPEEPTE